MLQAINLLNPEKPVLVPIPRKVEAKKHRKGADYVIIHNPMPHVWRDMDFEGKAYSLNSREFDVITKKLAKRMIGDWESPFYPAKDEIKAIAARTWNDPSLIVVEVKHEHNEQKRDADTPKGVPE